MEYSRRSLLHRRLRRLLVTTALRRRLLITSLSRSRLYDGRRHKRRRRLWLGVLRRSRGRVGIRCRSRVRGGGWSLRGRLRLSRWLRLPARCRRRLLRRRLWILGSRSRRFRFRFSGRLRLRCSVGSGRWWIGWGRSGGFGFRSGHWSGRVLDARRAGNIHEGIQDGGSVITYQVH